MHPPPWTAPRLAPIPCCPGRLCSSCADRKLILIVRHGQAVSNYLLHALRQVASRTSTAVHGAPSASPTPLPLPPPPLPPSSGCADRKLILIVRHGQAVSNYLSDLLGPDEWFKVEGTCQYDDKQGTIYNVFDAGVLHNRAHMCTRIQS
jgi:hypothetical protein